jgi:hypothetical protein
MKKHVLTLLAGLFAFVAVKAQAVVTYTEHVAPIIYSHCTNCHRAGEVAPFPLTSYWEAVTWSSMIKYTTGIRYMPPWKAEVKYQDYQHENYLADAEIQTLAAWVDGGMQQGNPTLEPPLPVFPTGSQVGTPDLVVSFSESYKHLGNGIDEYRHFVLPTGLTQDKDIVALEVRPGNKSVVHHTLVWQDTTGDAAAADAATPEYGYESGQGSALSGINGQLPGYVPGQKPQVYTNGIGMRLFKGADLKLQMHYAPTAADEWDSSSVNIFFAQQPLTRYVKSYVMLPLPSILTNGPYIIPANTVKEFHGQYAVPSDISMIGIAPHMHKLGQHWKVFAVKPNGDTVNLININEWDFNWQGTYSFKKLLPLPQGSIIHASAEYDNTTANINNPNNPPQTVSWGENTKDEMYYLPLLFLDYRQGDENVEFNETTGLDDPKYFMVKNELYPVAPNPAAGIVKAGFTLGDAGRINLKLFNQNGELMATMADNAFYLPGLHTTEIDLSCMASGVYTLMFEKGADRQAQKVLVIGSR